MTGVDTTRDAHAAGVSAGDDLHDRVRAVEADIATICGTINTAEAQLVQLLAQALDAGLWAQAGILSPEHWVTWKCGVSAGRARQLVSIARRRDELPVHAALLDEGRITVDQAAVVAKYAPADKDAEVAVHTVDMTVSQLRRGLAKYAFTLDPDPARPVEEKRDLAFGTDDNGTFSFRGHCPLDEGAQIEAALRAARDRIFNDAETTEERREVDWIDALLLICERSQRQGATERPDSDRHRVLWHLDCDHDDDGDGDPVLRLQAHLGSVLPTSLRRYLLCDTDIVPVIRIDGVPVSVGRAQHIVPDRTRRLIEHRDRTCRIPGCERSAGLHIHHIVHWEDGGATDTCNLCCLCRHHHRMLHKGLLSITGNADDPDGLEIKDRWGDLLEPSGKPRLPDRPPPPVTPYRHPSGERLDTHWLHYGDAIPA